jgi:alpha-tubulin suppressor-like RCC1 family protein
LKHLIAAVAIKAHGALVAWGNAFNGGDTTEVADRLTSGVVTVFATQNAFAALKDDGSVVIWGNTSEGGAIVDEGNPGHLLNWLTVVDSIPNNSAFTAVADDGTIYVWGNPYNGGVIDNSNFFMPPSPVSKIVRQRPLSRHCSRTARCSHGVTVI